jgi:uroporphyrinogen decarboxylase
MKASTTSRERVMAALNHQEVDRIPIDLGGTHNTTICTGAYKNLKAFLGVNTPTEELSATYEWAKLEEVVLSQLPVDTRSVFARPTRDRRQQLDAYTFIDDWGITWRRSEDRPQYHMIAHPLAEATIEHLDEYDWPDVEDERRYAGLGDQARDLRENTNYAICAATLDTCIFDRSWALRGMEQFLVDMLVDPEFALALLEKVAQIQFRRHECFLERVGPYIDAIMIGDDMGVQDGLLIKPDLYREMVKPFHKRYIQVIKERTDAKVIMHACGGVTDIIDDYIEIGAEALNPVQVTANKISPPNLHQRFGGRITFWGGIDTQKLLPQGQPEEVRQAVRTIIQDMAGLNGGYILASVHNVQDDVPPENVVAMLNEGATYRRPHSILHRQIN